MPHIHPILFQSIQGALFICSGVIDGIPLNQLRKGDIYHQNQVIKNNKYKIKIKFTTSLSGSKWMGQPWMTK